MYRVDLIDRAEAKIHLEFLSQAEPFLHCTLPNGITPTLYKWLLNFKEELLVTLGVFGIEYVYVLLPKSDKKALKFNKKMGFTELEDKGPFILLHQEI